MATLTTYVKLKDTSTTLIDPKSKVKISGRKPFEVEVTPMIQKAIAANVLIQMSEDKYKVELAAWNKEAGISDELPKKEEEPDKGTSTIPQPPINPNAGGKENVPPPEKTKSDYEKEYLAMKGEELVALAAEKGVDITGLKTKAEISAKLVAELYKGN